MTLRRQSAPGERNSPTLFGFKMLMLMFISFFFLFFFFLGKSWVWCVFVFCFAFFFFFFLFFEGGGMEREKEMSTLRFEGAKLAGDCVRSLHTIKSKLDCKYLLYVSLPSSSVYYFVTRRWVVGFFVCFWFLSFLRHQHHCQHPHHRYHYQHNCFHCFKRAIDFVVTSHHFFSSPYFT